MNNDEPGRRRRRRSELLCRKSHKKVLLNSLFGGDTLQDDAAFKTKRRFLSSFLLQVSRSVCVMTTQLICKLLRSKEASAAVDVRTWPPVMDTGTSHTQVLLCRCVNLKKTQLIVCLFSSDDLPKKKPPLLYKPSNPDTLAYLDFSVSTTGMLAGVKVHVNSPPENQ